MFNAFRLVIAEISPAITISYPASAAARKASSIAKSGFFADKAPSRAGGETQLDGMPISAEANADAQSARFLRDILTSEYEA